ncbi:MAG: aminotransferase class I/II-fold pyridoxal phosphate-dependent enzyme, partial [Dokdonella sp.]|uniref:pyridoxal phosphate-dependent aminotransferase n=1 Tax=Dokdonella sp. TaxID=2291710 RepID=UPI0032652113
AIAASVRSDTRLIYLANPNNPTGTWFDDAALELLLARVPATVLVVVDEAYHEFVDAPGLTSALAFANRFPNLVVTRTFSKAHALAGLRVGYLVADARVVAVIERLRESFNVNSVGLAGAEAALSDRAHVELVRSFNAAEREWLAGQLVARGYVILPSQTNFILVDLAHDAADLERHLFDRGVIVRPMGGYGLSNTVRISIGCRIDNQRLLDALP